MSTATDLRKATAARGVGRVVDHVPPVVYPYAPSDDPDNVSLVPTSYVSSWESLAAINDGYSTGLLEVQALAP